MAGHLRIGTSGWSYDHWDGAFYPGGLKSSERLAYYASRFPTVEINATFYRLPAEKTVEAWRDSVPADFAFAVKGSRFITHFRRLAEVGDSVRMFCDRVELLGNRLHVVLWQLPAGMTVDVRLLDTFLAVLPGAIRHAIEFRDASWLVEQTFDVLSAHNVAHTHVSSDVMPIDLTTTADFVYVRLHGLGGYHGEYVERPLEPWAGFLRAQVNAGRDAYVYFNNDARACAPHDAVRLARMCASGEAR